MDAKFLFDQTGFGAGCRDRTRDPLITNQVLYQLSYAGFRDVNFP